MPAIITNKFRVQNAKNFINPSASDVYYAFIGKSTPWSNELTPDTPVDSVKDELSVWDDMIAMKKITTANMSHAIRHRKWTSGTYYDIYRHDYGSAGVNGITLIGTVPSPAYSSLADANFYVVTADFGVYVCISNNGGNPSTVDPSTLVYDSHKLASNVTDNYVWKFIGRASVADITKFSTSDWHPIKTLAADPLTGEYTTQWANQVASENDAGAIFHAVLNAGGTGYGANLTNQAGIATITGDGTGATALVNTNGSGTITKITVNNYGSGYTWAKINFITGTNASATAIITPSKGLGADPVEDLVAYATVTNVRFEYDDGQDFPVTNDFRRFGLILNPTQFGSSTLLSDATVSATLKIKVNSGWSGNWDNDVIIRDTTTNARAVIVDAQDGVGGDLGKKILFVVRTESENSAVGAAPSASFTAGNIVEIVSGGTASGTISAVQDPEVQPDSGQVIYIENRRAVTRSIDQIESLQFVFEF